MFIAATFRDEELEDAPALRVVLEELEREPHFGRISLGPLTDQDTRELVRVLLGTGSVGRGEHLVTRAM
jgi:hypothetical protein